MSRAWLLPEHLADVLPAQAWRIETLRRRLLDLGQARGFELVIPPLLEHLESLLSGTGRELDLKTFKLVDQLSGRTLGLRADTTPQAARIDAHLLNREGVTRLAYCGPALHAQPAGLHSGRELLQFGAEIFGHGGLEADLEVQEFALDALYAAGLTELTIDLADARVLRGILAGVPLDAGALEDVALALSNKDAPAVRSLSETFPAEARDGLRALLRLFGGDEVLSAARTTLPARTLITRAIDDLQWLAAHLRQAYPDLRIGFDLGDMSGYAYYSGARFAVYAGTAGDAIARGGRYDEVGAVFGRNRPAAGFSLDLRVLVERCGDGTPPAAVRAPWGEQPALRQAVRRLREQGQTVVWMLPGDDGEDADGSGRFDRELVAVDDRWVLRAL